MGEKLQLEDMRKINFISSPDICPNNTKAVYTLYSTKEEDGDFYPKLYEVDLLSKNINKLNFGGEKELDAVYSSDGKKMAFISDRSGVSQLYLYDFENKDFSKLTSMIHGVESFKWSHKGDKIAFVTPLWPEDENIYEEMSLEERLIWKDKKENEPKVIEEIVYKYDDTKGVFDGSFKQIGLVDINTKEVSLLTEGNYNNTKLVWSYDDKMIAFLSNRRNHVEKLPNISDIYVLEVKNKYLKKLDIKHQVFDNTIEFTKDGKFIIYSGIVINEDDNALWIDKLFKCSIENGEEICITPKEESFHGINQSSVGKTVYGSENPTFCLSECGEYVYFKSSWDGSCNIYCVNLNGEPKIQKITDEVFNIHSFCKPLEGKILYTRGDTTNIGDLYIYDIKSKKEDKLTNCNSWLDDINLNAPIKFTVRSKDGKANIQGWVYKPIDFDENKKYPAILEIHGGPSIYTASDFCFEYHRLAAEGMVVLAPDVRGSAGYGEKFMDGRYAWSNEAFDDFMSYIDCAAEEFPYIDLDKLGVTGGSYGGYMTNKIIGLSDRFKAAVTQRTLINKGVSYGAGDIGFVSTGEDGPPEFPKCDSSLLVHFYNRLKTSPICNIDNIKLPLLILHGDKDYRCDLQQADQIFTAMKDRHPDIPCKLVIFKDENHGITRIGKIHNQMGHLHEMTEWFKKYLFTKEV